MTEEVLLRVGIDAKGIQSGLKDVGSLIKGWGTQIQHQLKGVLGGWLAAAGIEEGLQKIKERLLDIVHASNTLFGNSSNGSVNFIQNLMKIGEAAGTGSEGFLKPLKTLSVTLGEAAEGSVDARKRLIEWGIATRDTNFTTLTLTSALQKMSDEYKSLNTQEERNAMLNDLASKGFANLIPVLEQGSVFIGKMNEGNFFTKFTESSVKWAQASAHFLDPLKSLGVTATNALGWTLDRFSQMQQLIQKTAHGENPFAKSTWTEILEQQNKADKDVAQSDGERIDSQQKLNELKASEIEMTERIAELQNQEADRNKPTIERLADRALKLLGLSHVPRGIDSIYSVTPAMRQALDVQTAQDLALKNYALGNAGTGANFTASALAAAAGLAGIVPHGEAFPNEKIDAAIQATSAIKANTDQILGLISGTTTGGKKLDAASVSNIRNGGTGLFQPNIIPR